MQTGDRVRRIGRTSADNKVVQGEIYKVERVDGGTIWLAGIPGYWDTNKFELAPDVAQIVVPATARALVALINSKMASPHFDEIVSVLRTGEFNP